jgi:hypothetical protein
MLKENLHEVYRANGEPAPLHAVRAAPGTGLEAPPFSRAA